MKERSRITCKCISENTLQSDPRTTPGVSLMCNPPPSLCSGECGFKSRQGRSPGDCLISTSHCNVKYKCDFPAHHIGRPGGERRALQVIRSGASCTKTCVDFWRTPKSGKLLRTNKSGCINPCVSTISRRFSLYIPINVKLSVHARARLSALSPPSLNMLISINRPAVVRLL